MPAPAFRPIHNIAAAPANVLHRAATHPGMNAANSSTYLSGMPQSAVASGTIPGTQAHRTKMKADANAAVLNEKPGFITKTLDGLSNLGNKFFMYDFLVLSGVGMLTGGFSKLFGKLGEWTKWNPLNSVGNWFGRRQAGLTAQQEFIQNTKVSESLSKTAEAIHGTAGEWFGQESSVARSMENVVKGATKAEDTINQHVDVVFGKAGTAMGSVARKFDAPLQGMAAFRQRRAEKLFPTLTEKLGNIVSAFEKHATTLGADAMKDGQVLKAKALGSDISLTAAEHMQNITRKLGELSNLTQTMPDVANSKQVQTLFQEIRNDYNAVQALHTDNAAMKTACKEVRNALKSAEKPLNKVAKNVENSSFWKNLPETMENMPQSLKDMDLRHGVMTAAIGAGTLAEGAHTAFAIKHDYHLLKSMVEAVEGKEASILHVLTGDIPPVLKEARHHFFAKHGPETIFETIAAGFNLSFLKKSGGGGMAMVGLMAAPIAGNALADQNPTLQLYETLEKLQHEGTALSADMYAEFVHAAAEDTHTLDLGKFNPLTRSRLFSDYAKENITPNELLKEIDSGKMVKRAETIEEQVKAQINQKTAAPEAAVKPVLGQHTAKVVEQRDVAPEIAATPAANDTTHEVPMSKVSQTVSAGKVATVPTQTVGGTA